MKQLKHFIFKLGLFALVFITSYSAMLFILTNLEVGGKKVIYRAVQGLVWKGGFSYDRFKKYNHTEDYNILVFGSSRANRGIDPSRFEKAGFTMYNFGTDDQTPINTCVLVKEFVKRDKCKLVILDVYDKVFTQNPLESNSDLIQNLNNDCCAFKMTLAADDLRAVNQFGVRMMLKNQPPEYKDEGNLYNGFRALHDPFKYSYDNYIYRKVDVQFKAFDETLAYLNSIGVPFVLTCQPLPQKPLFHDQFVKDLQPLLKKYNATLYDYTYRKDLVPGGFADMSHLNSEGAVRYSDYLIQHLVQKVMVAR